MPNGTRQSNSHRGPGKLTSRGLARVLIQALGLWLIAGSIPRSAWVLAEFVERARWGDKPPIAWNWEGLILRDMRDEVLLVAAGTLLLLGAPRLLRTAWGKRHFELRGGS